MTQRQINKVEVNEFTITDHLPQHLKVSAVLETSCQSLSTIITNAVTIKTACEQMNKEYSQLIRFYDVCVSLVCILIISLHSLSVIIVQKAQC